MSDRDTRDQNRWLLPDGVNEVLPPQARALERMRRELLDLFDSWGYELVIPPLIEYLESLLTGVGHDLDLQTFKITDQLSGRMMGVRADMTPQAARIEAHQLKRAQPVRLCYIGSVLHTRPQTAGEARDPIQVGAELYGHGGVESDVEIITLLLETLRKVGIQAPYLDLGHVGIYRCLARQANLSRSQESALFDALQRKAVPDLRDLLDEFGVDNPVRDMFTALPDLNGGVDVLDHAGTRLAAAGDEVRQALTDLWSIAASLERRAPGLPLHFDLAELRGYQYQTGVVFAAFVEGHGAEVARGGRYDEIGKVFGRSRPATGFSANLKTLLELVSPPEHAVKGILAPWGDEPDLVRAVQALRKQGERVIWQLPGQMGDADAMACDRRLVQRDGRWQVENV